RSSRSCRRNRCRPRSGRRSARRRESRSADRVGVTFFEQQARARRSTSYLVALFALAVAGVVLAVHLVVPLAFYLLTRGLVVPSPLTYALLTLITLAVIGLRTLVGVGQMRGGGDAVARLARGVRAVRGTRESAARGPLHGSRPWAVGPGRR